MDTKPKVGQIWSFNHVPGRVIRINAVDYERGGGFVTDHEDVGTHRTLKHVPISFLTLLGCWTLEQEYSDAPFPVRDLDSRKLCTLKRHAIYIMRYPSERRKGRIIELLQWDDNEIPGEGRGYRDVGLPSRQQKAMATSQFRERWIMAADHVDKLPEYLAKGRPLNAEDESPTGRKLTARKPRSGDGASQVEKMAVIIKDQHKKIERQDKTISAMQEDIAAMRKMMAKLAKTSDRSNVIPLRKKAHH